MKRVLKRLLIVIPGVLFTSSVAGFMILSVFGVFWVFTGEYFPEDLLETWMDKFETMVDWANR